MSNLGTIPPYRPDSRGNRLEASAVTREGGGHVLWLRGSGEIAWQVVQFDTNYHLFPQERVNGTYWTHALWSPGSTTSGELDRLLTLLKQVIVLPRPDGLDVGAIALDWYKIPQEGIDPRQWPNTPAGGLVNGGKYRSRTDGRRAATYGIPLVDRMCGAIDHHGLLRGATVVLDIPGHDSTYVSFGSRVAATVAQRLNVPMVRVSSRSGFRPPAKDGGAAAVLVDGEFYLDADLSNEAVLIVDDVFRSGTSMGLVARAARAAGAKSVAGICAVRTLRR